MKFKSFKLEEILDVYRQNFSGPDSENKDYDPSVLNVTWVTLARVYNFLAITFPDFFDEFIEAGYAGTGQSLGINYKENPYKGKKDGILSNFQELEAQVKDLIIVVNDLRKTISKAEKKTAVKEKKSKKDKEIVPESMEIKEDKTITKENNEIEALRQALRAPDETPDGCDIPVKIREDTEIQD